MSKVHDMRSQINRLYIEVTSNCNDSYNKKWKTTRFHFILFIYIFFCFMLCTLPYLLCLCLFAAHSHIYATCASVTRDFPIVTLNLLQAQKGSCSHSCNASFIKRFFLIARSFSLVTSKHMIFFGISVCVASSVRRCCKRFY